MKISVVIPAHNRPDFLRQAVASIASQTHHGWQIVIVDDGSDPPIDTASVLGDLADRAVVLRHPQALGVARAKNAGVGAATGEIVTILDDDDLLVPSALQQIERAFVDHPELDCLFLGVEPFGADAAGAAGVVKRRQQAIEQFLAIARGPDAAGLCFFDERLFRALTRSVPIDFQRPAARKGTWNIVGGFDEAGLYSESGWAIRAAAVCRVALSVQPLTLWRIHAGNFGWSGGADDRAARLRRVNNGLATAQSLVDQFRQDRDRMREQLRWLEAGLSDNYFDKAYLLRDRWSAEGVAALATSVVLRPRLKHVKLMLRYLLRIGGKSGRGR